MQPRPLRTTVIGSHPFPSWLEFASANIDRFGPKDIAEIQDDAVTAAVHDQVSAGLDVITDGEMTRLDFNLSFYGYLEGIERESAPPRRFGPPGHDQRGKHKIVGELAAPSGLGVVEEYIRLSRIVEESRHAAPLPTLKASVPGPYTLSGRLLPGGDYGDRWEVTEALLPIVRRELEKLQGLGCQEIAVDEPSMSCYAHKEDPERFVDIFNRTVEGVAGRTRITTHLCFGNYKGRPVGPRRYAPMFPAFLKLRADEIHVEMASREFAEIEVIGEIAKHRDVAVGVIDVKGYYIETPNDVAERVRLCLRHAPAERLAFAPDCGLSQIARWAARTKLENMVEGVGFVCQELGL